MAAGLDVEAIARLANEFFGALPASATPPAAGSPAAVPARADSVAPPATPAGVAPFVPSNPGAVPVHGAPGSPAYIYNSAEPPPGMQRVPGIPAAANSVRPAWDTPQPATAPTTPDSMPDPLALTELANEFFAALPKNAVVPGLPGAVPPLPPSDPGALTAPAAPTLQWPPAREFFSFPSVPGVPDVPGSPPSPTITPAPELPAHSQEAERVSPFDVALSFPVTSDLFIMPGLPGAQSLPGTPVLPSSPPPTQSPAEPFDVRPEMTPDLGRAKRPFDPHLIRRDFPILQERVNGHPLIWLDNAATTQKPNAVIDRLSYFYQHENSNVHRAAHTLAARATDAYESAREKVRRFLNASSTREIVFVRGTTEGINLVAQAWGRRNVQKDDEIVITWLEHHANIVPWQQLAAEKGARLRVAPVDDRGEVILEEYERLLGPRTRIVAFTQVSNALGTITPAREMVEMAHRHGARVLVDGAQSVAHMRSNVQALDCDFFVFSGHKIFGPTGIGVLYGKADILDNTPPWQGGGSMIVDVTFERTVYQKAPARFEAGTGNIADAVGLGAALDYLDEVGIENVNRHEHELLTYATAALNTIPGLRLIGTAREKAGVLSFVLDEFRTEDVGVALNQEGIAVRAGHHCAQPILRRFGVESTVRPSLALYNITEDIDALVAAILRMQAGRRHGKL
jgi:cysteine desulfurase/selenocysteine lyase